MLFNYMGYRFKASSRRQKIEDEFSLYKSGLHFFVHTLSQMGAVKTTCAMPAGLNAAAQMPKEQVRT